MKISSFALTLFLSFPVANDAFVISFLLNLLFSPSLSSGCDRTLIAVMESYGRMGFDCGPCHSYFGGLFELFKIKQDYSCETRDDGLELSGIGTAKGSFTIKLMAGLSSRPDITSVNGRLELDATPFINANTDDTTRQAMINAVANKRPQINLGATGDPDASSIQFGSCTASMEFDGKQQPCDCQVCGYKRVDFQLDCTMVDFAELLVPGIDQEYYIPFEFQCFGV